jgi:hypothetical protein
MNKVENFIISSKIIYFISSLLIVILGLKYFKKRINKEDILLILLLTIIIYVFLEYLVKVVSEKEIMNRLNFNFMENFENSNSTYTMQTNPDGSIIFMSSETGKSGDASQEEEEEEEKIKPFNNQKHAEFTGEEEEEEMHIEEKEMGKNKYIQEELDHEEHMQEEHMQEEHMQEEHMQEEHMHEEHMQEEHQQEHIIEKPIEKKKGFFDSLLDKMKRPSTEDHILNAEVPISYVNNDRTLQPININVSYNNTKYDNDGLDEKKNVYANGMNYYGGKLQTRDMGQYQFDDGMKKKNAVSEPVRVNDWMTKQTPGIVHKEPTDKDLTDKDLTDYFANYQKQMNQKMGDNGGVPPQFLDFRNKSASPQKNVLTDDNKSKDGKQLFYTPNGDTILNPDIWKGAFFGTDRPNYCPEQTKDGSNTCPVLLNNFWSEWKTYPNK